jgi:Raf kinase inhibitor-like YbhB/YbcL family protein
MVRLTGGPPALRSPGRVTRSSTVLLAPGLPAAGLLAAGLLAAGLLAAVAGCTPLPGPADRPSIEESSMARESSMASDSGPAKSAVFRVTSPAFADGGAIPRQYTCDAADVSPPLTWSGAPAGTAAFALLVTDPDARGFVHWVALDIPASSTGLAEGATGTSAAGLEGRNDFGRAGWGGPCPPSGTHRYVFELYALSAPLELSGRPTAEQARRAMAGRVIGKATLTGTYRRAG